MGWPSRRGVSGGHGRRWVRRGALLSGVLLVLWLGVSLAVACRLTRRDRPIYPEPVPGVAWGSFEPLRLRTRDGQDLGAWLVRGAPGAGEESDAPSVVLLHGNGACRSAVVGRAQVLASRGCTVLMVTMRAHGDSTGELNDIGFGARHDVVAAVAYLERRRPGRPIVVHGTSLGAAAAVFASGTLGGRVRGYILESPYRDLKTAVRNRTENALPPVLDRIAYLGLRLAGRLVLPGLEQISPLSAIGGIPDDVPVLILAGGEDRHARPVEARALYGRVRSHARLIVFERGGHMNFPETEPDRYARAIRDFVADVARRAPAAAAVAPPG